MACTLDGTSLPHKEWGKAGRKAVGDQPPPPLNHHRTAVVPSHNKPIGKGPEASHSICLWARLTTHPWGGRGIVRNPGTYNQ